ncbi:glycosyltransferase family 87 protein [Streptomyces chartreusis]|uniref:glycosyltransferase family 87 protein n=1 Tax=Streptomyces chartreusis TaxID=1969 RepID=UPI002E1773DC
MRSALYGGHLSIALVGLVLLGCSSVRDQRVAGVLVGVAAALQPMALLFLPFLWRIGRRSAAASCAVTFALCTVLAAAALPHDTWTYWVHHPAGAALGPSQDIAANQ